MANLHKGFKRIVWIVSIISCLFWWILVFIEVEFKPEIDTDGLEFINYLDENPREFEDFNFGKIAKAIPTLNMEMFKLRYTNVPDSSIDTVLWKKAVNMKPEEFLTPELPLKRMILVYSYGFIPFVIIWLLWFLTIWIICGFRG